MMSQATLGEWAIDPRDCWATPPAFFAEVQKEGMFTVDACALPNSAKVPSFWSPTEDGLAQDWRRERVWCNPPYSDIMPWAVKCATAKSACLLVPVRCDVGWWHWAIKRCSMIDFMRGRIAFIGSNGVQMGGAPERYCIMWFGQRGFVLGVEEWLENQPMLRTRDAKTGKLEGTHP